jgi:hypothetical protein
MSTTGVITATGTKGLLQYLKTYQPELYQKVNPALIAYAKQQNTKMGGMRLGTMRGFSALRALAQAKAGGGMQGMGSTSGSAYFSTLSTGGIDPNTGIDVDSLTALDLGTITPPAAPDLVIAPTSAATDSASVASSGATSSGFASIISSIAKGFGTATLTAAQVSANNTLLQTNLARAQAGLPPLTASTGATGLTTLGSPSTSLLLLGGALLVGLAMMGNSKAA